MKSSPSLSTLVYQFAELVRNNYGPASRIISMRVSPEFYRVMEQDVLASTRAVSNKEWKGSRIIGIHTYVGPIFFYDNDKELAREKQSETAKPIEFKDVREWKPPSTGTWKFGPDEGTVKDGPSDVANSHVIRGVLTTNDAVVSPNHYDKGGKQVWDLMKDLVSAEEYRGYLTLNVVKYVSRYKQKGGKQDLLKARAYIDKLIETEYGDAKD